MNESLAAVRDALQRDFAARLALYGELAENVMELGQSPVKADESIKRSMQAMEAQEFEAAFEQLRTTDKEARAAIAEGLFQKYDGMKQRATVLKGYGTEILQLSNEVARGRELARSEKLQRGARGLEDIRIGHQRPGDGAGYHLNVGIARPTNDRQEDRNDTTAIFDRFQEARQTLAQGDFSKAAATVAAAEKLLEKALEGYREVETELASTKALLLEATGLHVDIQGTKRLLESSRKQTIKRDFRSAVTTLHEAQDLCILLYSPIWEGTSCAPRCASLRG